VDREGKELGIDRELLERLRKYDGMDRTIAGGVASPEEIRLADEAGVNAQVGMAFHTGKLQLGEAIAAPLKPSDRSDGLWPTVVTDETGCALGLVYSSRESLKMAVELRQGIYHSRRRGLWIKGADSGNTQDLLRIDLDCDRDSLRFTVRQHGSGFCHNGRYGCWGNAEGLKALEKRIRERIATPEAGSYTARLLTEPGLLGAKLIEEAQELDMARGETVAEEAADLFYFGLVALARSGISLHDVERILDRRSRKVTRRPGDAKMSHLTNGRKM
jgi:phosphoribosyl-ATP pyrophosphohydrolase